jgi:hypothetical protein
VLKVYVGVVRLEDGRDFIIMVDGEPQPVGDSVRQVMEEIWGEGEIAVSSEGVDFTEYTHSRNQGRNAPDGYVLTCEVGSLKRMNFAVQYARRLHHLNPGEGD